MRKIIIASASLVLAIGASPLACSSSSSPPAAATDGGTPSGNDASPAADTGAPNSGTDAGSGTDSGIPTGACQAPTGGHYAAGGSYLFQIGDNGWDAVVGVIEISPTLSGAPVGLMANTGGVMTGIDVQRAYTFTPVADGNGVIQATLLTTGLGAEIPSGGVLSANVDAADPSAFVLADFETHLWCIDGTSSTGFDNPDTNSLFDIYGVDGSCAKDATSIFDVQVVAQSNMGGTTQWFEFKRDVASGPVTKTAGPSYTTHVVGAISKGHGLGDALMNVDGAGNVTKDRDFNICQNGAPYTGNVKPSTALLW